MTEYACLYCGSHLDNPNVAHAQQAKRQVREAVHNWLLAEARWWAEDWRDDAFDGFYNGDLLFPWETP